MVHTVHSDKQKNYLTIRLTESVVFLQADASHRHSEAPPSMLRGLLTLKLAKPTKISRIDLNLIGKASNTWPQGVGGRRIEFSEEHEFFSASTEYFRATANPSTRRTASVGPGASFDDGDHEFHDNDEDPDRDSSQEFPNIHSGEFEAASISRHHSVDGARPESTGGHGEPGSPYLARERSPAYALEESRNTLLADLSSRRTSPSAGSTTNPRGSPSPNPRNLNDSMLTLQRSTHEIPEIEYGPSQYHDGNTLEIPTNLVPVQSRDASITEHRGRRHARFSFASVSNALFDSVLDRARSSSPRMITERERAVSQGRSIDLGDREVGRGRPVNKGKFQQAAQVLTRDMSALSKRLKFEPNDKPAAGEGWKEFKKGIYTYPISFVIPATSPPSLKCTHGSVTWHIKAYVHRPGPFSTKLSAQREVVVIACPGDGEEENIIVERQWDSQLQYLVSVSGRHFFIGGSIPIQITLMPIAKIKVYRITVSLEEKLEYYTQMKEIAHSEPASRFELLSVKSLAKDEGPILPLVSNDVNAFKQSPLYALVSPTDNPSEMASSLMGPGPWTFHKDFAMSDSCDALHFTNKNRKSNIEITHMLKIVIRMERGDNLQVDPRTGKRKLFDIVVKTPVIILSCWCNTKWTTLPRYSESFEGISEYGLTCPCEELRDSRSGKGEPSRSHNRGHTIAIPADISSRSSDTASIASTTSINRAGLPSLQELDSLVVRNAHFERLISGQESEIGEAPPAYDHRAQTVT